MGRQRLKVSDIVKMTGLARNTVSELYHGTSKRVDLETLDKLCIALECDLNDIITFEKEDSGKKCWSFIFALKQNTCLR
ncbi:helix-turn-helix transcriptional regulator [Paenibacillus sp. FSL K6-3182]|uniref:helix-turn-helix domain-containing protein n=1 Tax=unclassified Paenibacillus TaxID=185978 RepID=UPI0030CE4CFD